MANENHASYAKVGFAVFIGVIAIVATLIYIGGLRGRGNVILAETYYDKPVSGLSVGSVVNFRGVKVGEVKEIAFVGNKYDVEGADNSRIYILMALDCSLLDNGEPSPQSEIEHGLKMLVEKAGLRATVTSSGITGLSRIECDYRPKDVVDEPPKISWKPAHLYIPPRISLLDSFGVAATKVMNQINRMDFTTVWSNVSASVESLARLSETVNVMVEARQAELEESMGNFSEVSSSVRALVNELRANPSLLIRERVAQPLEETAR